MLSGIQETGDHHYGGILLQYPACWRIPAPVGHRLGSVEETPSRAPGRKNAEELACASCRPLLHV